MDDASLLTAAEPREFRCPGQKYGIDRAQHVARLAAFYPGCLECEHRHDARGLSSLQLRERREIEARIAGTSRAGARESDVWSGPGGKLDGTSVCEAAGRLAARLWRTRDAAAEAPVVLVGGDGTPRSADWIAAACGALQTAGCRAVEVGAVTSPALAHGAQQLAADAAIWLGDVGGHAGRGGVRLWVGAGRPASRPGMLDEVFGDGPAGMARPRRRGGGVSRADLAAAYVDTLRALFHGLRPLVIVLDTVCEPWVRFWRMLSEETACRLLRPHDGKGQGRVKPDASRFERPQTTLAAEVVTAGAHLGAWIDGDGEVCQLVDERGHRVDPQRLLLAIGREACREIQGARVVLEPDASGSVARALEAAGARVFSAGPTRQAMYERMLDARAVLGGGPSGRLWVGPSPPTPDALAIVSRLASLLSQSDRPLSEVLDAAAGGG